MFAGTQSAAAASAHLRCADKRCPWHCGSVSRMTQFPEGSMSESHSTHAADGHRTIPKTISSRVRRQTSLSRAKARFAPQPLLETYGGASNSNPPLTQFRFNDRWNRKYSISILGSHDCFAVKDYFRDYFRADRIFAG